MGVETIDALSDDLKSELVQFVKTCSECGKVIIGTGAKKRCAGCQRRRNLDCRIEYGKKNYRSLGYEKDSYISHLKGRRKK